MANGLDKYRRHTENKKVSLMQFDSLMDFYSLVEANKGQCINFFKSGSSCSSENGSLSFTGTSSIDEALYLAKHGWQTGVEKLNSEIKIQSQGDTYKNVYDIVGGHVSVPRFLNGYPTNMIRKIPEPRIDKVITLVKVNNYNCGYNTDTIIKNSVKFIQLIQKLEADGYRCNVDLIYGTSGEHCDMTGNSGMIITRFRIKRSSERLNVMKMSFPLAHPSMQRRLYFKLMEMDEVIKETSLGHDIGYGYPVFNSERVGREIMKKYLKPNEYFVPLIIDDINNFKLEKLMKG